MSLSSLLGKASQGIAQLEETLELQRPGPNGRTASTESSERPGGREISEGE